MSTYQPYSVSADEDNHFTAAVAVVSAASPQLSKVNTQYEAFVSSVSNNQTGA